MRAAVLCGARLGIVVEAALVHPHLIDLQNQQGCSKWQRHFDVWALAVRLVLGAPKMQESHVPVQESLLHVCKAGVPMHVTDKLEACLGLCWSCSRRPLLWFIRFRG